jgi:hypothetical protein
LRNRANHAIARIDLLLMSARRLQQTSGSQQQGCRIRLKDADAGSAAAIGKLVEKRFLGNDKVKFSSRCKGVSRAACGCSACSARPMVVVAMNRAAEQALPESSALRWSARSRT